MHPSDKGGDSTKRAQILEHLAQAKQHIAQGEAHIAEQRLRIADLRRDGHATGDAERFLATLEELQETHLIGLSRIQEELATASRE